MSKKTIVLVGAAILVLIVAGVVLLTQLDPQQSMSNGPGMIYFFSPV